MTGVLLSQVQFDTKPPVHIGVHKECNLDILTGVLLSHEEPVVQWLACSPLTPAVRVRSP